MQINNSFHLKYIKDEYARRTQANPHYSLRAFARDLGVSPSWLSDFMLEKKGMSDRTAIRMALVLGLTPSEEKVFLLSAKARHARSPIERATAQKELNSYKRTKTFSMRPNDFLKTGTWYHQAILELTELENFTHHEFEIAERLRLPLPTIRRALSDLHEAGLLEFQNGRMKACFPETESTQDIPTTAIRKYHEQILQKGVKALHEQAVHQREYGSATFAFDASRIEEAKAVLRSFQKRFSEEFYKNSENKDSVYQFSFQFFRVDQKRK